MASITRTPPLETVSQLATLVAEVQLDRTAGGRRPLEICFAPFGDRTEPAAWAGQIRRDLGAYEDAGVTWLTLEPHARTLADMREAVSLLAEQVIGP
jgi:hypothetical protein